MTPLDHLVTQCPLIESRLNYNFSDRSLLTIAFTHRSFLNENKQLDHQHNERLEFLGDSVLGLIVSEYLYRYLPSKPEGELSTLRARLVEAGSCGRYVQTLHVEEFILLGKGERLNSGRGRESILADLFEAIVGAIYLDGGLAATKKFLFKTFGQEIQNILATPEQNWKAILQDYVQKNQQKTPSYLVLEESGPDHSKLFSIAVCVDSQTLGIGSGPSKKAAQQAAALEALKFYGVTPKNLSGG